MSVRPILGLGMMDMSTNLEPIGAPAESDGDCCQRYSLFGVPPDPLDVEQIKLMHPTRKALREDRLPHIWCAGCGIGSVVNAFVAAVGDVGLDWKRVTVVSGIGCTGRVSGYMKTDSFHTTHGRAIPFAVGLGLARPDIKIVVVSGDGDLAAIGGNHLIHAARRNADMTVLCVNNFNYGMTGGQHGPTTQLEARTKTTPQGAVEYPFNLPLLMKACGATYVARWTSLEVVRLQRSIAEALSKPGFSFVEIIAPCPTNYGGRNRFKDAESELQTFRERTVFWEGEPLEEIGVELGGRIVIGTFVDKPRDTFRERLLSYSPAWPPKRKPAAPQPAPEELQAERAARRAPRGRREVRIAGAGGQGIMLAGALLGEAASVHDGGHAVAIPSYGPESRGGASKSDIVLADEPIEYPEVREPNVLVVTFQEAYDKYKQPRAKDCVLIAEQDLVKLDPEDAETAWTIPALEWARELGEPRALNMIILGFIAAVSDVVAADSVRAAIRRVGRLTEKNLAAFDRGYQHGVASLSERRSHQSSKG
jgi:2-oxoglutarate ferredoxin oxidoreductase subunit beta